MFRDRVPEGKEAVEVVAVAVTVVIIVDVGLIG